MVEVAYDVFRKGHKRGDEERLDQKPSTSARGNVRLRAEGDAPETPSLRVGSAVRVDQLVRRTDLNGLSGRVVADAEVGGRERYGVRIEGSGEHVLVRAANLSLQSEDCEEGDGEEGTTHYTERGGGGSREGGGCGMRLRWGAASAWRGVRLPAVRTAAYMQVCRTVIGWSGIGEGHEPERTAHAIDADVRRSRLLEEEVRRARSEEEEASSEDEEASNPNASDEESSVEEGIAPPQPRGGALLVEMAPNEAVMLCGSDHELGSDMSTPYLLTVPLGDE